VVRNVVVPDQFTRRPVKKTKPVIGWVGALGYRSGDVETTRDWLPDFLENNNLMFHHSGWQPDHGADFAARSGINPERLTTSPMRPFTHYHEMFSFDIGIVPLNTIPFNEAKSYIKGLEYAASGIPFVAQGLSEYELLTLEGVGNVATTPDEWVAYMTRLLDYGQRKKQSATNYAITSRRFAVNMQDNDWLRIVSLLD
jgi:hypothetical protein